MYLHGAPSTVSPIEQRRVPLMLRRSDGRLSRFHDSVFHCIPGMLRTGTAGYSLAPDIFSVRSRAVSNRDAVRPARRVAVVPEEDGK